MQDSQFRNTGPYSGFMRLPGILAVFLALLVSNLTVWADTKVQPKEPATVKDTAKANTLVSFSPNTQVMLFAPSTNQWSPAAFQQAKPGGEFTYNSKLYRLVKSGKAQVALDVDVTKLPEADRPFQYICHPPWSTDVVQVLDQDMQFTAHEVFRAVKPGTKVRFQGRAYGVKADHTVVDTGITFPATPTITFPATPTPSAPVQRIVITKSAWQHIIDRHTPDGKMNAGKSIFNRGEDIRALIKNAEPVTPVLEPNKYLKRVVNAGRPIGYDGRTHKQTSLYRVITKQSGELVTAYPVLH